MISLNHPTTCVSGASSEQFVGRGFCACSTFVSSGEPGSEAGISEGLVYMRRNMSMDFVFLCTFSAEKHTR